MNQSMVNNGSEWDLRSSVEHESCWGNNCSYESFSVNRLWCYQCNNGESCDLISSLQPKPCNIPSEYDGCFSYVDKGKIFIDGSNEERKNTFVNNVCCQQIKIYSVAVLVIYRTFGFYANKLMKI